MDTFDVPPPILQQLRDYADAVQESPHNLLSNRALGELWDRHIAESVAFARSLPPGATHPRVLDLGTGGGLPGMVVAIVRPDLEVTLLDSTAKKMDFLRETATEIGVTVTAITGRAEDVVREHPGTFDVVTARAVAALDQLIVWALPFLRPGGELHAIKGARWTEELRAALPTLERARATVTSVPDRPHNSQDPNGTEDPKVVIIRAAG